MGQLADHFAALVRTHRTRSGITQQGLSEELAEWGVKLDATAIAKIENGQRAAKFEEAAAIAAALNFTMPAFGYDYRPPAERWGMLRQALNNEQAEAVEALRSFVSGIIQLDNFLHEHANLFGLLMQDVPGATKDTARKGQPVPTSPDDYLKWMADRQNAIEYAALPPEVPRDPASIRRIVRATVRRALGDDLAGEREIAEHWAISQHILNEMEAEAYRSKRD